MPWGIRPIQVERIEGTTVEQGRLDQIWGRKLRPPLGGNILRCGSRVVPEHRAPENESVRGVAARSTTPLASAGG